MHRSLISFTKQGLNTIALHEISSEMTTLLEITNSLVKFAYSARYIYVKSACTELANTEDTCTRGAKSASIEAADIGSTCTRDIYSGGACVDSTGTIKYLEIHSQSS